MNDNPTPNVETRTTTTSPISSNSEAQERKKADSARRKFTNLANGRVRRATIALRVLGNLAKLKASDQQMSETDVNTIMAAIDAEVASTRKRLLSGATGTQLDVEDVLPA